MNPFRVLQSLLNRLLPFTRPGTPLLQDVVHTVALCAFLYFAPAIFENRAAATLRQRPPLGGGGDDTAAGAPHREDDDVLPAAGEHDAAAAADGNDAAAAAQQFAQGDADDDDDDDTDTDDEDMINEADLAAFNAANPHFPQQQPDAADVDPNANPDAAAAAAAQRRAMNAATRQVGAKKARSLQRRDQRRAYHEFVRSQGEAQRARERAGQEEREAELYEEKRRRAVAEAALEERRRREREARRERERRAREDEVREQREALALVRRGLERSGAVRVDEVLRGVGRREEAAAAPAPEEAGREWLERLLRADGVVGRARARDWEDGCVRLVTAGGWVVRVDESDMQYAWKRAAAMQTAKITFADLGEALEELLRNRA